MRRTLVPVVLCIGLVAGACTSVPTGPLTYAVGVDAASPEGKNFQYSAYFPSSLKARPGDTVVFGNDSTQAPHTVTFGIDAKRSNQPAVVLPTGAENPTVQMPCYTQDAPSAEWTECPEEAAVKAPAYTGQGYWNSGFLVPAPAPSGPKKITLTLDDSISPGTYRFICILHAPMTGAIEVVDEDGERESTDSVVVAADEELSALQTKADRIPDPNVGRDGDTVTVAAGWGDNVTAVNRFFPGEVEVEAGTTVRWEDFSPYEPHTVSVGEKFKAGDPSTGSLAPSGIRSGSSYTGGEANSGILGREGGPYPAGPFTLTFTRAGTYSYVCILHPGQEGVVKVT